jgi:hypothetical protein
MKKIKPIIWGFSAIIIVALLAFITPKIITLWEPTNPEIHISMIAVDENQNLTEATQEIGTPLSVYTYLSNLKGIQNQQAKSISVYYGPQSQTEPYNYPSNQTTEYPGIDPNLLELIIPSKLQSSSGLSTGFEITFPQSGTYYLRAQALVGKQTLWSKEELKVNIK